MKNPRPLKIIVGLFAALLLVLLAVVIFLMTFDWNRARPWINQRVSDTIGREFAINGDLRVHWEQGDAAEPGWRRYVPRPRISANDVYITNPTWTSAGPKLASAGSITVALHPLPLLHKQVAITDLAVEGITLAAQRRADGSNTWTFKHNGPSAWDVDIQRLTLGEGDLRYIDDGIKLDLRAKATGINEGPDAQKYGIKFDLSGSYRNAPVSGGGKLGKVLALTDEHTRFPVQANANLARNKIAVEGILTDPRSPAGLDLKLSLGGASMADLYPLTGVLLPETPPYATTGRLIGKKSGTDWNWTYKNFNGTVGGSDLEGTLAYSPRQPRPLLSGAITSRQLRLEDLGPTIGAESNTAKAKRNKPQNQPEDKALPVEQFNTAKWDALDADVKFTGKKLVRTHDIPLSDIQAHIKMNNKVLTLTPLNFGMAGGDISANIKLDGRQTQIDAQVRMAARHLKINQLFPKLQSMQASVGEISADAALAGKGNSVSAMLATSSGEMGSTVSEGSVSKFVLEAAGLNIANLVFVKMFGDKQIQLNCMAGDFVVEHGKATTRRFVVDTQEAVINVNGYVDLSTETLDLDVRPQTKGVRIVSLRTPLYARGTFTDPKVGPQAGPLALKAGAAVALATVAPLAAVIPLINTGKVDPVDCKALLAEANKTRYEARTKPVKKP
ncbi:AsmA family protein [Duganella sp. FT94W]|uniref:AsmA family protein n=1 Tax=Duganella lactea TaxID=2692173 RepID=A0ABW9V419_9BURK|nr:AsmA family protein [Duganella lactea]MYM33342.1 AsmA family protein [Duganella lactea]